MKIGKVVLRPNWQFVMVTIMAACLGWKALLGWIGLNVICFGLQLWIDVRFRDALFPGPGTREPGIGDNYREEGGKSVCKACATITRTRKVTYPVKFRGLENERWAQFGEYHYEIVHYCPKCDSKPAMEGSVVYYSDAGVSPSPFDQVKT